MDHPVDSDQGGQGERFEVVFFHGWDAWG
jgi:hypothetical protein